MSGRQVLNTATQLNYRYDDPLTASNNAVAEFIALFPVKTVKVIAEKIIVQVLDRDTHHILTGRICLYGKLLRDLLSFFPLCFAVLGKHDSGDRK